MLFASSSGARLPQSLIKVKGGADSRPGVCVAVCKCVREHAGGPHLTFIIAAMHI